MGGRSRLKQIARRALGVALAYALALQSLAAIASGVMAMDAGGGFDPRAWLCANLANPAADRQIDQRPGQDQDRRDPAGLACHFMAGCVSSACSIDGGMAATSAEAIPYPAAITSALFSVHGVGPTDSNRYRPANARAPPLS